MGRTTRAAIAAETLAILEAGGYALPDGTRVSVAEASERCCSATRLWEGPELQALLAEVKAKPLSAQAALVEVRNETTLEGIARLGEVSDGPVLALNFASAMKPGGGFIDGAQSQEESLARSSGLHPSLMRAWPYYERHRALVSALYTDTMILSPACPVFRDDDGALAERTALVSFITSPAPNAGVIQRAYPHELPLIPATMRRRAEYVLALAAASGHAHLVLGAWGCGVFHNDPAMVAQVFASLLFDEGWVRRFARVNFSVLDLSPSLAIYQAFSDRLVQGWTVRG